MCPHSGYSLPQALSADTTSSPHSLHSLHKLTNHQVAVGSAAHLVMLFDLRQYSRPLATLVGHRKAVSYVRSGIGVKTSQGRGSQIPRYHIIYIYLTLVISVKNKDQCLTRITSTSCYNISPTYIPLPFFQPSRLIAPYLLDVDQVHGPRRDPVGLHRQLPQALGHVPIRG